MPWRLQESAPPDRAGMWAEVMAGLTAAPKYIPSKYFYDAAGSRLFELICRTPEYYVTRTERQLLRQAARKVARLAGRGRVVIEPGSGSSDKFALLAEALAPSAYVPVEICADALGRAVEHLSDRFPGLELLPCCGDFAETALDWLPGGPRLIFFPGSTIGNIEPPEVAPFLARLACTAGRDGALLIGVDLKKDPQTLHAAYNDGAGLTAAFNLNLLTRLNRELEADFDPAAFAHRARYNAAAGRVEMHLVSRRAQRVPVGGRMISLAAGEAIHTENSYKYTVDEFREVAQEGGWRPRAMWVDAARLFSVHYLVVSEGA
jgi:dimethylhistidine N-methyltransferase